MAVTPLVSDAVALILAGVVGIGLGIGVMVGGELVREMRRKPQRGRHEREDGEEP